MNPAIKAQWVAALRSGDYVQGQNRLRNLNIETHPHCCLGVLTDLYVKANDMTWADMPNGAVPLGLPPVEVGVWAGFKNYELDGTTVYIENEPGFLHVHNDSGKTFLQIADAIESQL